MPSSTQKGIDFTPDANFEEVVNKSDRHGKATLNKGVMDAYYEELAKQNEGEGELRVGHAGLYWEPDGSAHLQEKSGEDKLIETTVELGRSGKGQLLVMCEDGIANMVRELADDDNNHLPSTKTGVVIHYLTEGIARDFGITFTREPVSLGGRRGSKGATGRDSGQRPLTKKEKNELLDRCNITFYQQEIEDGSITFEEAQAKAAEAFKKKLEYEKLGYYLSPNKTEGVMLYDWKQIVDKSYSGVTGITKASTLYIKQKIEVLVPDLYENYFADNRSKSNKTNAQHLLKSPLSSAVINDAINFRVSSVALKSNGIVLPSPHQGQYGGLEGDAVSITSNDDILKLLDHKTTGDVKGIHLAKLKTPGMMKPRYIVVDECVNGKQVLKLYGDGGVLTLQQ